jgi:hypothetical protein
MQIGMSDKSVLRDFHPDAEDLYNVTMDLSTVCKELKDRNKRMPRRVCTLSLHASFNSIFVFLKTHFPSYRNTIAELAATS